MSGDNGVFLNFIEIFLTIDRGGGRSGIGGRGCNPAKMNSRSSRVIGDRSGCGYADGL
jgi:hypothetical protein